MRPTTGGVPWAWPGVAEGPVLPFSTVTIDRAGHRRRDEEWLAEAAADPSSRLLAIYDGARVPIGADGALAWAEVPIGADPDTLLFLGIDADGRALFAVDRSLVSSGVAEASTATFREAVTSLPDEEAAAALQAFGLASWHRRHPFCPGCGTATKATEAGHVRRCPNCETSHFPRMDPAVIMLVSDGDSCVLGRRRGAPGSRWSTLAGYVEPGESPEAAVCREVHEEVGLSVDDIVYRGSQPWPFPASLMLAFSAHASRAPLVISDEHEEVRWFTRDELRDGLADGSIAVPGAIAAGSYLISSWLD